MGQLTYRRRSRPPLRAAITARAADTDAGLYVLPTPRAVRRFLATVTSGLPGPP